MYKTILFIFTYLVFFNSIFSQQLGPQIYFIEKIKHIKNIRQGTNQSYTFEFINRGDETLEVKKIKTNCSCLKVTVSSNFLGKNEKAILTVKYKVPMKKGMTREKILVHTNSKKKKKTVLKIIGKIVPNRI